jgi:hypothetical protein
VKIRIARSCSPVSSIYIFLRKERHMTQMLSTWMYFEKDTLHSQLINPNNLQVAIEYLRMTSSEEDSMCVRASSLTIGRVIFNWQPSQGYVKVQDGWIPIYRHNNNGVSLIENGQPPTDKGRSVRGIRTKDQRVLVDNWR